MNAPQLVPQDKHSGRNIKKVALHTEKKGAVEMYYVTDFLVYNNRIKFTVLLPQDSAHKIANKFNQGEVVNIFVQESEEIKFVQDFIENITTEWVILGKNLSIVRDDFSTFEYILMPAG